MEFAGLFTGALVPALFAGWALWHERRIVPSDTDYVTPKSLWRHSDVSRFCEHGGLAGPGARVVDDFPRKPIESGCEIPTP